MNSLFTLRNAIAALILGTSTLGALNLPSLWWLWAYPIVSTVTFVLYGLDKRAAIGNRWRISERILHSCSVLGGWPGALLAQSVFRHKTQKTAFQMVFWGTVLSNVSLLGCAYYFGLVLI